MAAPNGARRTKADHPNLPIRPDELARDAAACAEAGATLYHLHVRDRDGRHLLEAEAYRAAIRAVEGAVGDALAIQVTTEAAGRYGPAEQMAVVRALRPRAVSLALRELFAAPEADAAAFLDELRREAVSVNTILYSPDDASRLSILHRRGAVAQARPFALLVLGRYGDGAPGDPRRLPACLSPLDPVWPFAVCAFGRSETACLLTAAGLGGHVRVGFENNLDHADGTRAGSNAERVARIADGLRAMGLRPATIAETRAFLADTAA